MRGRSGRVLGEPTVAFLLLGVALWVLWSVFAPSPTETLVVDTDAIRMHESRREELLGRPLRPEERETIRESWIEEELLLREAERRGLDRSDPRARERLLRLMRGSLETPLPEPTREQLEAYFEANLDRYWERERLTLDHVFFPHGSPLLPEDPDVFVEQLERDEFATPDDPSLGRRATRTVGLGELRAAEGASFAEEVAALPPGEWSGPIVSSSGVHYLRLIERESVPRPELDSILSYVRQDWESDQRREQIRRGIDAFRDDYRVLDPAE